MYLRVFAHDSLRWLKKLDQDMRRQGRKILLLIDNAPSHIFDQSEIANVRVEFFSPNMTSVIQPMDAGIIRCFKAHYKRLFCERAILREESGEIDLYKLDQLEGMILAQEAWDNVTSRTVTNCWTHVKLFEDGTELETQSIPEVAKDDGIQKATQGLQEAIKTLATMAIAPNQVMRAEEMLDSPDETVTEELFSDVEIVEEIRAERAQESREATGESDPESEVDEMDPPVMSKQEGIRALRDLSRLCAVEDGEEFRAALRLFPKLIRALRVGEQADMKQTTLSDYFS